MEKIINVGGRLHNPVVGGALTGADEIKDDTKGKMQNVINQETDAELVRLDGAKQEKLTFDQTPTEGSTNPVTSGGVYAADAALQQTIEAILLLIPSAASALNQLADKSFVNSSISTATATFRGTYNLVTDLELTVSATHQQIAAALASVVSTADNNDYCFVQIPVSDQSTDIRVTERYKFDGISWEYEYDLNNSGFTADQWAAINSGITSVLVSKLGALPTDAELAVMFNGKQNTLTFDSTPVAGSDNPVKSSGLYNAFAVINAMIPEGADANNKLVAENRLVAYVTALINALDATFDVTSADGHVTLRMTQSDGLITSVQVLTSDIASASALTTLGGRVSTAESDIDALQDAYAALTQSDVVIVNGALPSSGQQQNIIYRQPDQDHTPPQFYSDYMWNGTTWVLMATYMNAIDARPKKGSQNLVTSGGVFDNMGALDVSELNATENPHTLATYADLSAALAAIPSDYQKGGMSIKFVQTSDNKYVQYFLTKDEWSLSEADWQKMNLEEEVSQLGQKLFLQLSDFIVTNKDKYNLIPDTLPSGFATIYNNKIIAANGEVVDATNNYSVCSFNCEAGQLYKLRRVLDTSIPFGKFVFMDSNNNILAIYLTSEISGNELYIFVPYGVSKIMFSSGHTSPFVNRYTIDNFNQYLYDFVNGLPQVTDGLDNITLNNTALTENWLIQNNELGYYPGGPYSTPIIPYNNNCTYKYTGYGAYDIQPAAYYDKKGNIISCADPISGIVTDLELQDIPEGTVGIRFCSFGGPFSVKISTSTGSKIDGINEQVSAMWEAIYGTGKRNKLSISFNDNEVSSIVSDFNDTEKLKQTFIINPTQYYCRAFNLNNLFKVNKTTGIETLVKVCDDDICPVNFGVADYIGANHGAYCLNVLTATHDKTATDIGSIWSDGTHQFTLIGIESDKVHFVGENLQTYPKMQFASLATSGTLTHVSGATNTSDIVFTAKSLRNWGPICKALPEKHIYADNIEIIDSGEYTFNILKVSESYDVLNPVSVVLKIQEAVGTFSSNPVPMDFGETADVLLHLSNEYIFNSADECFVATSLCLNQESNMEHFGFTQCIPLEGNNAKLYIPKAKSKNNGATAVDYRTIISWSDGNGLIRYRDWEDVNLPPDRIIGWDDNIGIHIGYLFDYGVGGNNRKAAIPGNTAIYITPKLYPYGWSAPVGEYITGEYANKSAVCFRKFIERSKINTNGIISTSVFEYNGHCYIYADFNAAGIYEVKIPSKYQGGQVEVLEKRANVSLLTQNASDKILLRVNSDEIMYGYFVGKI